MMTLDAWYRTKIEALKLKGEYFDLKKRAQLEAFYRIAKVKKVSGVREQKEWTQLYKEYLNTGSFTVKK